MKTARATPTTETVESIYDILEHGHSEFGIRDFTEGIYYGNPNTQYEEAQRNQRSYLLDEAGCGEGTRLLEIGCGRGTLLQDAKNRGTEGIGLTLSGEQRAYCRNKGLDVRQLNYRDIDESWNGRFDAVIANGSAGHFVQVSDVAAGRDDDIYREMFEICHRLIDPESPSGRFVTTVIYDAERGDPHKMIRNPFSFFPGSHDFHMALLIRTFGCWSPALGQLEQCAKPYFVLEKEVDGTLDYHWTSEEWLKMANRPDLRARRKMLRGLLPVLRQAPIHLLTAFLTLRVAESWNWQFRTDNPPMRLLRQTWTRRAI